MSFTQRVGITIPILWLGFVLPISFMEAWLKFQAEGVTQVIGLSIGRLVFGALNKVELFFMAVLLISAFKLRWFKRNKTLRNILIALLVLLLAQTFYLLPALDQRAVMIINGSVPSASYFHFYHVFFELSKVILLGIFSHRTLTKYQG
jgi:hypothetical protein